MRRSTLSWRFLTQNDAVARPFLRVGFEGIAFFGTASFLPERIASKASPIETSSKASSSFSRTNSRAPSISSEVGGSLCRNFSVRRTHPMFAENAARTPLLSPRTSSVEPPPRSTTRNFLSRGFASSASSVVSGYPFLLCMGTKTKGMKETHQVLQIGR